MTETKFKHFTNTGITLQAMLEKVNDWIRAENANVVAWQPVYHAYDTGMHLTLIIQYTKW